MMKKESKNEMTYKKPESILIYVYDPMCSWCYGFRPTWKRLKGMLSHDLPVVSLLGGLAEDSTEPMTQEMVEHLRQTWIRIQDVCGVEFNHKYWSQIPPPPRTTFIACRAVIAAEGIAGRGEAFAEHMQDAYYREAKNIWNENVLGDLAAEFGFRRESFLEALVSDHARGVHDEQRALAQRLNLEGYPSLLLIHQGEGFPISVRHGGAELMFEDIQDLLAEPNA